jgi:WD40 repeat protein
MPYIEGRTLESIVKNVRCQQRGTPSAPTPNLATLAVEPLASTLKLGERKTDRLQDEVETAARSSPLPQPRLSADYFRSVATVMADAADAFHYAHGMQILHRDLKPSNLMVDAAGQCWVIDFGLAAYLSGSDRFTTATDQVGRDQERATPAPHLTAGNVVGTPSYMAPEQWTSGIVDERTDVWGLGATLYELLTLERAFPGDSNQAIQHNVLSNDPTSPHLLTKTVPRDLEAVCMKALKKDSAARYQSAQDFAVDLRRWLNHEPVAAQRTRIPRRVWLWARRNRAWAAAIAIVVLLCGGFAARELHSAQAREREQRREGLLQQVQNVRLLPHQVTEHEDWLEDGWTLVRQAVQLRKGPDVQDQAAALLAGVNARRAKWMPGFRASSIAVDAEGRRVLIGGTRDDEARLWDPRTDQLELSGLRGSGPVTFSRDGAPWQLVCNSGDRFSLILWDVTHRRIVRELRVARPANARSAETLGKSKIFLTSDGAFAAATTALADGSALVTAWETSNGGVIRQIAQVNRDITALAVSENGSFVSLGDSNGQVSVWPLPTGVPFPVPSAGRTQVESLAFGPNARGRGNSDKTAHWLLAGGDASGKATIWDLGRRVPVTTCRGSYYNIHALAFSPDGVTLATTGRAESKLWDIATGRLLLDLHLSDYMTGIAFSRDAHRLATSMERNQHPPDVPHEGMLVWDLEYHRGVQSLRGLDGQIAHSKICFAQDSRRIAAISLDWRIAIWELPSGFLHSLFEMSPGLTADNSGLAFSHDGRRFACSVGAEAKLWDLESGHATTWRLPEGLGDTLAFDATDTRLWLFRVETLDGMHPPHNRSPARQYPRACRIRDLLASREHDLHDVGKNKPAWETHEFDAGDVHSQATPDGKYLVAAGRHGLDKRERVTSVFESATGKVVLSLPADDFQLDVTGQLMLVHMKSDRVGVYELIKLPTGELVDSIAAPFLAIGPGARLVATKAAAGFGYSLRRRDEQSPFVTLGIDALTAEGFPTFSSDGGLFAWGNRDGTVTVCHLEEVQRRLASVGLGW